MEKRLLPIAALLALGADALIVPRKYYRNKQFPIPNNSEGVVLGVALCPCGSGLRLKKCKHGERD